MRLFATVFLVFLLAQNLQGQGEAAGFSNKNKAPEWFFGLVLSPNVGWEGGFEGDASALESERLGVLGYHLGLRMRFEFKGPYAVELGLAQTRWGMASRDVFRIEDGQEVVYGTNAFLFNGLSIPLYLGREFRLSSKVKLGMELGFQGTLLWTGRYVFEGTDESGLVLPTISRSLEENDFNPFTAHFLARINLQLRASQWWVMQIAPVLQLGLNRTDVFLAPNSRINSIGLSYSILYSVRN